MVHEPPERVVFEVDGDIECRVEWTFEEIDGGTYVTYSTDCDLGLPTVVDQVLRPITTGTTVGNWGGRSILSDRTM